EDAREWAKTRAEAGAKNGANAAMLYFSPIASQGNRPRNMTTIGERLLAVQARIAAAAKVAGRDPAAVSLLAVSKTWPADVVRAAAAAGQRAFGENYVQEGVDKVEALRDLGLEWHFIGPLQSNKTRPVAN